MHIFILIIALLMAGCGKKGLPEAQNCEKKMHWITNQSVSGTRYFPDDLLKLFL